MTAQICFWLSDYETVLKLDPGNVEAQNELKKIKEVRCEILDLGFVDLSVLV